MQYCVLPSIKKIQNCLAICCYRERDAFEEELSDVKKQLSYLEAAHQAVTRERDELSAEVT